MPIRAEWWADGLEPIGDAVGGLPVSNLAARERRTVAISDVLDAPELADPSLGSVESLSRLGTRAALATPVIVFDRMIGVLGVHRPRAGTVVVGRRRPGRGGRARDRPRAAHGAAARRERAPARRAGGASEGRPDGHERARAGRGAAAARGRGGGTAAGRGGGLLPARPGAGRAPLRGGARLARGHRRLRVPGRPRPLGPRDRPRAAGALGRLREPPRSRPAPELRGLPQRDRRADALVGRGDGHPRRRHARHGAAVHPGRRRAARGVRQPGRARASQRGELRRAHAPGPDPARLLPDRRRARPADLARGDLRRARPGRLRRARRRERGRADAARGRPSARRPAQPSGPAGAVPREGPRRPVRAAAGGRAQRPGARRAAARGRRALRRGVAERRARERLPRTARRARSRRRAPTSARSCSSSSPRSGASPTTTSSSPATSPERPAARSSEASCSRPSAGPAALAQQLARTGALLATELDPAAVLDEVVAPGADAARGRRSSDPPRSTATSSSPRPAPARTPRSVLDSRVASTARLAGDAVQSRAPVAVPDAREDQRLLQADPMLAAGYASCVAAPLVGPEGAVQGVLSVYCRAPRAWREEEIEALAAFAGNASAALSSAELYQSVALEKERSVAILSNIADGIVAVDREGKVVLWNAAAERITGVPGQDALGHPPSEVLQRELESGERRAGGRAARLAPAWRRGDLALADRGRDARPGGRRGGPHLRLPRHLRRARRRADEVRVRLERLPRAALAADLDLRLRRDAAARRRALRRGGAHHVPRLHRLRGRPPDLDRRPPARGRPARLGRPPGAARARPTSARSSPRWSRPPSSRSCSTATSSSSTSRPSRWPPHADREKLRQIVMDLVENAVKYSPGGGTVRVSARRRDDTVEVSVEDEGIGIPQSEQSADLREVLPRREQRPRPRERRHRPRALHRQGAAGRHARPHLGALGRGRGLELRLLAATVDDAGPERARVNRPANGYRPGEREGA